MPVDVKFRISINIFSHNQHTLYVQFCYVATSFDPETGSPSGHDKKYVCIQKLNTRIYMYTETKYKNMHVYRNLIQEYACIQKLSTRICMYTETKYKNMYVYRN